MDIRINSILKITYSIFAFIIMNEYKKGQKPTLDF